MAVSLREFATASGRMTGVVLSQPWEQRFSASSDRGFCSDSDTRTPQLASFNCLSVYPEVVLCCTCRAVLSLAIGL